jgi:hypothetical protein
MPERERERERERKRETKTEKPLKDPRAVTPLIKFFV